MNCEICNKDKAEFSFDGQRVCLRDKISVALAAATDEFYSVILKEEQIKNLPKEAKNPDEYRAAWFRIAELKPRFATAQAEFEKIENQVEKVRLEMSSQNVRQFGEMCRHFVQKAKDFLAEFTPSEEVEEVAKAAAQ